MYIVGRARIVLTPELEHPVVDLTEDNEENEEAQPRARRDVSPFDESAIFTPEMLSK